MVELKWTLQAADDLEAIVDFIAKDSHNYATLFAIHIIDLIESLRHSPMRGRVVPEIQKPHVREILYGNYRIIYRTRDDAVEVLTVYHGARLLRPTDLGFE